MKKANDYIQPNLVIVQHDLSQQSSSVLSQSVILPQRTMIHTTFGITFEYNPPY